METEHYLFAAHDCTCASEEVKFQIANSFEATPDNLRDLTQVIRSTKRIQFVVEHQRTRGIIQLSIGRKIEIQLIISERINCESLIPSMITIYRQNN